MRKITNVVLLFSSLFILITGCNNPARQEKENNILAVFHAGSLSVPFKIMADQFEEENPGVKVRLEAAGSVTCVRKITDLNRSCDVLALADLELIDEMMIPDHASWAVQFASNEMSLAYMPGSAYSDEINESNWYDIISREDVRYGRSNPDSDPCGYRTVLSLKLADSYYPYGIDLDGILSKDHKYIRPKETDLLALLETNTIDYMFIYSSVAVQHNLKYVKLPESLNLGNPQLEDLYATVSVDIAGKKPGAVLTLAGRTMVYGFTLPLNSSNPELGKKFAEFLLNRNKGLRIMEESGQKVIDVKVSPASVSDPDF